MKPILFDKTETDFTTNGLGRLECISCEVIEERNGMYELEAEIPISGQHTSQVSMQSIIGVVPHDGGNIQAFYVYKVGKPINGRFKVYARHISYRLTDIPCSPFSVPVSSHATNDTLQGLKNHALEPCPFTFYTDLTTAASYNQKTPDSIRKRLGGVEGSVIDQFGGEFEWDNWNVKLLKQRGSLANTNGISLRYGKNITDLNQEEEIASTVTGVVPYWIDTEGNNLVMLPEYVVYAPTASQYAYHLTQVLDLSANFESQPTVAQLRSAATNYVNKYEFGIPKVSIQVSFVNLWETEEYKDIAPLERVKLCDEITVDFEKLGVKAIAKVVKTRYDVLKERYISIEVGSIRSTLAQAITDRDRDIDTVFLQVITRASQAAQDATAWLTSANGYVVAVKNTDGSWKELLFMDTNDPSTAHNVLRINNNGLGFSTHGINGPYENAWTIDGRFIADFIRAGALHIGGSWYPYDPETEEYNGPKIIVYNVEDDPVVTIDENGITINEGLIQSPDYREETPAGTYSASGMAIDVNNATLKSEYFAINALGAFLKGTIEAVGGHIGAAVITQDAITIRGDIELYKGGNEYFTFKPTDYYLAEDFKLLFKTNTGNSNVILTLHQNGTDTNIGYYYATTEGDESATLNHLIGTNDDEYYRVWISAQSGNKTSVLVEDAVLAKMGLNGFEGTLRGIFKGYIESESGKIAGIRYSSTGQFYGDSFNLINEDGLEGHKNTIELHSGDRTHTATLVRTFVEYSTGDRHNEEVVWADYLSRYYTRNSEMPENLATDFLEAGSGIDITYNIGDNKATIKTLIEASENDIVAGSTPLDTGAIFLVYE